MAFKKKTIEGEGLFDDEVKPTGDDLDTLVARLQKAVTDAYESGVTMEEAERLAAMCLSAQLDIAKALSAADLDSRMKKNGLKATKANAYMREINAHDKKPAEGFLDQAVALDPLVNTTVDLFERADARKEELTLYFGIFKDAHIYFRGISKGNYQ